MTSKHFNFCPECGTALTSDLRCTNCNYDAVKDLPRDIIGESIRYIPPHAVNDQVKPVNERAEKNIAELKAAALILSTLIKSGPQKVAEEAVKKDSPIIGAVYILSLLLFFPLAVSIMVSTAFGEFASRSVGVDIWLSMAVYMVVAITVLLGMLYALTRLVKYEASIVQTINTAATTMIPLSVCSFMAVILALITPFPALLLLLISLSIGCASLYSLVTLITNNKNSYWIFASLATVQVIIGVIAFANIAKTSISRIVEAAIWNIF